MQEFTFDALNISSEAGNAEKTREDTPAAFSKASPEAGNVEKTQDISLHEAGS